MNTITVYPRVPLAKICKLRTHIFIEDCEYVAFLSTYQIAKIRKVTGFELEDCCGFYNGRFGSSPVDLRKANKPIKEIYMEKRLACIVVC